jgi:hypothetical protein
MATEEFGTVTFENGKPVPVNDEVSEFVFPDEVETKGKPVEEKVEAKPEVDIEIVDDTPEPDRNRKKMAEEPEEVTDDELETYDKKVQKRIKKLGKGYHDERRAKEEALRMREEAIRAAQALIEENKKLQAQLHEGSKIFIEQGKTGAEIELSAAKKAYKDAYDAGDGEALVDAQQRIAEATLKLDKAQNMRPIEPKESTIIIPEAQEEPNTDPKLQKWLNKNTWYGGANPAEDEMTGLAVTIHNRLAREKGEKYIGTDEYYEKISDTIRKRYPDYFRSEEDFEEPEVETPPKEETPKRAKPAANVVAPATRSVAPKKVQLTPTQVQLAKRLGVPLELYAKKVAEQINGDR